MGSWPMMLSMMLGMVAFWGLVAWVVVSLVRRPSGVLSNSRDAEVILAERFARGEIDEDEYRTRRALL